MITVSTVDNDTATRIILDEIRPKQYEHLQGKRIRLMEAARKNEIAHGNLQNWASQGYITVLHRGFQNVELDAFEVRFVSEVFKRARELTGSSIKAGWVLKYVLNEILWHNERRTADEATTSA